jgi:hypothetical protein
MHDLVNVGLRTLMCLAFLVWVVRPMLLALTRREPNQTEIEEVAQMAILSAFKAQNLPDVPLTPLITHAAEPAADHVTIPAESEANADAAAPLPAPDASATQVAQDQPEASTEAATVPEDDSSELDPAAALRQMRERMRDEQKKSKPSVPPELLQNANSYEDKLVVVRMLADQQQSRVASVIKRMIQP